MTSNHEHKGLPGGPASEAWKIASACLVVAGVVVLAIILSAGVVSLIVPPDEMTNGSNGAPTNKAAWVSLIAFQAVATFLIVAFVGIKRPGEIAFTFVLKPPSAGIVAILQVFAVFALVQAAYTWFAYTFFPQDVLRDLALFQKMLVGTPLWVAFLALVVGAPVSEEMLFRGFLMNRLAATRIGFSGAAIAATFGWTVLHFGYSTVGLIEVFLAGLMFSWALWRTGSLWVPMAFHAVYNAIVFAIILNLPAPAAA